MFEDLKAQRVENLVSRSVEVENYGQKLGSKFVLVVFIFLMNFILF